MINWRTIIGALLMFGALSELLSVIGDYNSGKLKSWPFGVEFGVAAIVIVAFLLMKKGIQKK